MDVHCQHKSTALQTKCELGNPSILEFKLFVAANVFDYLLIKRVQYE